MNFTLDKPGRFSGWSTRLFSLLNCEFAQYKKKITSTKDKDFNDGNIEVRRNIGDILSLSWQPKKPYILSTWEKFYSSKFEGLNTKSLHLTADSKFLTIAGLNGDMCVVLEIK